MIISASRRTDIPAFYTEWFLNRVKDGYVIVLNPFNAKQANKISLKPWDVDCIVFWTKNPQPLLKRINEIDKYHYYFQYTLNAYEKDMEPGVPPLNESIKTFIALSTKIGKEKVIWRYDPIILTEKYSKKWHIEKFEYLINKLHKYTNKVVISFVDLYKKTNANTRGLGIVEFTNSDMEEMAEKISAIAHKYNLEVATCAEKINLEKYGIKHNKCIDDELIKKLFNVLVSNKPDGQRPSCGCVKCSDIGSYNTCMHRCKYCYATFNYEVANKNFKLHNPKSPLLLGELTRDIEVYPKEDKQGSLFDI